MEQEAAVRAKHRLLHHKFSRASNLYFFLTYFTASTSGGRSYADGFQSTSPAPKLLYFLHHHHHRPIFLELASFVLHQLHLNLKCCSLCGKVFDDDDNISYEAAVQAVKCAVGGNVHRQRSSLESLFCYDNRRSSCEAKGAILCTTCSGSGLYVDSISKSRGNVVKVRCLGLTYCESSFVDSNRAGPRMNGVAGFPRGSLAPSDQMLAYGNMARKSDGEFMPVKPQEFRDAQFYMSSLRNRQ